MDHPDREGTGSVYRAPDRDGNDVPDWQEDENYRDEAPRGAPVGGAGCLLGLGALLLGVVAPGYRLFMRQTGNQTGRRR